jgi:hypothetical protein
MNRRLVQVIPRRKEVTIMTYAKPQIVALGEAVRVTKGTRKHSPPFVDNGGMPGTTPYTLIAAYEADE